MGTRSFEIIRLQDLMRQRWRNDGGWTTEIARHGDATNWDWRISVADVESDGPFSSFPGIERQIVLLEGHGMQLDFDDGEQVVLDADNPRLRFDGGRGLHSRLIGGPTRDFNLMSRRDHVDAELWRRPLVGNLQVFARAGETWVLHMLAGQARVGDADISGPAQVVERGDTLLVYAGNVRQRCAIEGAGEALLIRIARVDGVRGQ